jgi:hypothetical protein
MFVTKLQVLSISFLALVLVSLVVFTKRTDENTILERTKNSVKSKESYKQWLQSVEKETPLKPRKANHRFHLVNADLDEHHKNKGRLQQLALKPETVQFASGYPVGKHVVGYLDVAAELDPSDDSTVPAVVIPNQILSQSTNSAGNEGAQSGTTGDAGTFLLARSYFTSKIGYKLSQCL